MLVNLCLLKGAVKSLHLEMIDSYSATKNPHAQKHLKMFGYR